VAGLNFAAADLSPTAALATGTCGTTAWVAATAVACLSAAGSLPPATVVVAAGVVLGTGIAQFTFDGGCFCSQLGIGFGALVMARLPPCLRNPCSAHCVRVCAGQRRVLRSHQRDSVGA